MIADKRRVDVIFIPFALLEGAVEVCIHAFSVGFLVDVDSSKGWTFAEVGARVALMQTIGTNCSLHLQYYRQVLQSQIQIITLYAEDELHGLLEVVDDDGGGVVRIVVWAVVNACLGQEGSPADRVGAADVCSWVVADHEEASLAETLLHVALDKLEGQFLWLAEVELLERELMGLAVLFQHVVERPESQSRSVISSCPDYIILSSIIGGKRQVSYFFFQEDVVDDFKSGLVWTDIVESEDGVDDLPPLVVIIGQRGEFESGLQCLYELVILLLSLVEDNGRIISFFWLFVQYCVQLICSHVVSYAHLIDYVSDSQGSAQQQNTFLLAILAQMRANWTVIHEHVFRTEYAIPENIIHFLDLQRFQLSSSVCQASKRYLFRLKPFQRIECAWDLYGSSEQNPIDVSDDDGVEPANTFGTVASVLQQLLHYQ